MDFLGLRTLTVIDDAIKSAKAVEGVDDRHRRTCRSTIPRSSACSRKGGRRACSSLNRAAWSTCCASRGRRSSRIWPRSTRSIGRARSTPAWSTSTSRSRTARRSRDTSCRSMKELLEETYGVIVYQEQIMQIAQRVAGYSLGQADLLRKAMGKKDAAVMAAERGKFVDGAVANGYDKKKANEIFDYIEPFARYGFNKSHSVAYALVAYQTAWLKVHYPRHFMAALMTSEMDRTDFVVKFINEASQMGIRILPPDINESNYAFTVVGPNIRFGLGAVKGVGEQRHRIDPRSAAEEGEVHLAPRLLRSGRSARLQQEGDRGADQVGIVRFPRHRRARRSSIRSRTPPTPRSAPARKKSAARTRSSACSVADARRRRASHGEVLRATAEWPDDEKLRFEKETLGFYITGHPLNKYTDELKLFANATTDTLHQHVDDDREHRRHRLADQEVEDQEGAERREADGEVHPRRSARLGRGGRLLRSLFEVREVAGQRHRRPAHRRGERHRRHAGRPQRRAAVGRAERAARR